MATTNRCCDICGSMRDVSMLATGNLCAVCDSLGRLYAARTAYHEAQYRRGVEQGYQGSVTMHHGPPTWASDDPLKVESKRSGEAVTFRQLASGDAVTDEDEDRRMPPFGPRA